MTYRSASSTPTFNINDKILVRPRLLYARTRPKGMLARHSPKAPQDDEVSASDDSKTSAEELMAAGSSLKQPLSESNITLTINTSATLASDSDPILIPEESVSEMKQVSIDTLQKGASSSFVQGTSPSPQQKVSPSPFDPSDDAKSSRELKVKVSSRDKSTSLRHQLSTLNNRKPIIKSKDTLKTSGSHLREPVDDYTPDVHHYPLSKYEEAEESAKGFVSAGYIPQLIPDTSIESPESPDGPYENAVTSTPGDESVPRYPPLDREALYSRAFLVYLKDFHHGGL